MSKLWDKIDVLFAFGARVPRTTIAMRRDVTLSIVAFVFCIFAQLPLLYVITRQPFEDRVLPIGIMGALLAAMTISLSREWLEVASISIAILGVEWLVGYLKSQNTVALGLAAIFVTFAYLFRLPHRQIRGNTR